ncbi:MAG: ATP-binding protein [Actinomycetota bacterium]
MSAPVATEAVRVSVPAKPEFVHVLRAVTAAVSGRLPLSLDDVDDLRLAVDEASARLLALDGDPRTLRLDLRAMPGRLEVVVALDVTTAWPPPDFEDTLAWRVLVALAEHVRFEHWNGMPAIRIVKRTLGNGR